MKYVLILSAFLLSLGMSAQNPKSKKLYKNYAKGNYSKSKAVAKKMLSKERSDPDANYILAMIELQNAKNSKSKGVQKRAIKESITKRNEIKDLSCKQYVELSDSIRYIVYHFLEDEKLSANTKKYYVKLLASDFNDTLTLYQKLFNKNNLRVITSSYENKLYPQDSLRRAMLTLAQQLEGTPYKWAGDDPKSGFDCSGFTSYVYKSIGIELPHSAQKQSELIKNRKKLEEALPGDLIFFGNQNGKSVYTRHAGIIYSIEGGNIEVVHCVSNGVNIEGKDSSWDRYWINEVLFVVDVLSNKMEIPSKN